MANKTTCLELKMCKVYISKLVIKIVYYKIQHIQNKIWITKSCNLFWILNTNHPNKRPHALPIRSKRHTRGRWQTGCSPHVYRKLPGMLEKREREAWKGVCISIQWNYHNQSARRANRVPRSLDSSAHRSFYRRTKIREKMRV